MIQANIQMAAYDCRNLHIIDLVDAKLTIYLQPGLCNKVAEGVSEVLDSSLLRYSCSTGAAHYLVFMGGCIT